LLISGTKELIMNISSTKLHLTTLQKQNNCKPADCSDEAREECRGEIQDMVIQADNSLVVGTLMMAGSLAIGLLTGGAAIGTLSGQHGTGLGLAGTVIGGAATVGLHIARKKKESQAIQQMDAAFQRADETGCYSRDELYRWYQENVAG
jgi:hypothetical protein